MLWGSAYLGWDFFFINLVLLVLFIIKYMTKYDKLNSL